MMKHLMDLTMLHRINRSTIFIKNLYLDCQKAAKIQCEEFFAFHVSDYTPAYIFRQHTGTHLPDYSGTTQTTTARVFTTVKTPDLL
jgi:hypothetical protein